ncbi:permease family-domain-containing protein [Radiomyces spectabilis]|uniref:permease family-domain-containing protein n=1 Tax=Radiomyces spectabilis TaxID=64574 RepID=UPI00221E8CEC|nr:permease family-domain-containing protein [Radiomyces spectabilis]KAI8373179.1 permease family-domain-containing protein [Radiomyces spectabilis]
MEKQVGDYEPQLLAEDCSQTTLATGHKLMSWHTVRNYFPKYALKRSGVIYIDERPPVIHCFFMAIQHVLAMFGSTVLAPLMMGMDTNTALFFSGIGTIIFYIATGGRVPSYVGSSFGFIGVVVSATGYSYSPTSGRNEHVDVAAGGILICGVVYGCIGLLVLFLGHKWIEFVMPPVVTGAVVMTIGIHLSSSAFANATQTSFDGWMAFTTVMVIALTSIYAPGMMKRIPILIGMIIGYLINFGCGYTGAGPAIDYTEVYEAKWFAAPTFVHPKFEGNAISIIVPVCVVLVAENLGHIKAVGAMAEQPLDKYLGRAILGDAVATIVAASGGGPGTTTYSENIGVMAVTQIFSTLIFLIAAVVAIFLGFIQKFGAAIHTIPQGVFGGLSIILFGLITVSGARIWVENQVDFKDSRNLLVAGIPVVIGAAMQTTLQWGNFQLDGIGLPTYCAILLYQLLRGYDGIQELFRRRRNNKDSQETPIHLKEEEERV